MRPRFCATCIDGPGDVYTEMGERSVWLCAKCYDGADHSLPLSIVDIAEAAFERSVHTAMRHNPDGDTWEIADIVGGQNDANIQKVTRAMRRARRAA